MEKDQFTSKTITYNREVDLKRFEFIKKNIVPDLNSETKVLDVGCGNGIISMFLGSLNLNVLGIDISEKSIQNAISINKYPNVQFKVKSAEDLVVESIKFDIIICSEVLEHLKDPSSLITVLHKSLNSKGKLIVTVPNGRGPRELLVTRPMIFFHKNTNLWPIINRIKKFLGYSGKTIQSSADNLDHIQFFTKKTLYNLAMKNNFSICKFENSNFIEDVFPISLITNRVKWLERLDCKIADSLPHSLTGGFFTLWEKV